MKFITADYHLGHHGIIESCDRPFTQIRHMDSAIIRNHNKVVGDNDDVYILGDFSMYTKTHRGALAEYVRKLKGRLHLIMGNHDVRDPWFWTELGFWSVHAPYFELEEFVLVHDPALSQVWTSRWFLCGHIHTLFYMQRNCLNVGVDMHNFTPLSLEQVRNQVLDYENDVRYTARKWLQNMKQERSTSNG